jgi:5-methylcytosine-specific restriction protein A
VFIVGSSYTRQDIYDLLSVPEAQRGGDWQNGYHRHADAYYIFCNIGMPGRTGHDYDNHWEGSRLVWYGKKQSHFGQRSIADLAGGSFDVLVFHRFDDRAPFIFAGLGSPIAHRSIERPARIDWLFEAGTALETTVYADELDLSDPFEEGARTDVLVNRYERNRSARDACVAHHGATCIVCSYDFEKHFGPMGAGFIHVHHVTPISEVGPSCAVDPVRDLIPVCPNCHAMIHTRWPPISVQDMRKILAEQTAKNGGSGD